MKLRGGWILVMLLFALVLYGIGTLLSRLHLLRD
jgi:hypothetical protein